MINVPARGIGPSTVGKLEAQARLGGRCAGAAKRPARRFDRSPPDRDASCRRSPTPHRAALRELAGRVGSPPNWSQQVVQRVWLPAHAAFDDPEDRRAHRERAGAFGSIEEQERRSRWRQTADHAMRRRASGRGGARPVRRCMSRGCSTWAITDLRRAQSGEEVPALAAVFSS